MTPLLTVETRAGKPIPFRENSLVPFTQVWHLRLPWVKGGLIWNRPVSVVLQPVSGQDTVIPVVDVTRRALWLLWGLALTSLLLAMRNRKP